MTKIIFLCGVLGVLLQGVIINKTKKKFYITLKHKILKVHLSEAEVNNAHAKHVTQTALFGDDIKSWLTPYEGVLATENTPVYGLVSKPKVSVNNTGYEIIEHKDAMKNVIAYLRENKSDAITTPSNKPPKAHQEQSTVVENKIRGKSARHKTLMEINMEISKMLKINHRESNIKCRKLFI
ncbi:uncharacterized protein LOC130677746 [Microplitis mediator]|uniref:uncharacterized protein LOC130677746 n=1 Tax=Microplitis mediator TaxID=375433 RepID=UPI0025522A7C|nr:uncharacterized protein LOC130677746 [Microplitis mediator]